MNGDCSGGGCARGFNLDFGLAGMMLPVHARIPEGVRRGGTFVTIHLEQAGFEGAGAAVESQDFHQ